MSQITNELSRTMSRTARAGMFFILLGVASLAVINLADWFLPGRTVGVGVKQLLASVPPIVAILVGVLLTRTDLGRATPAGRRRRLAMGSAASLLSVLLAVLASGVLQLDRGSAFAYDSTTGLRKAWRNVVQVAGLENTRLCRCAPDSTARIALPGGFSTQIAIYDKGGDAPRPGLVVAHGNVWMGSDLSTYRLLASRLAQNGVIVLTIDRPGFGKADDPFGRGPSAMPDASDAAAILNTAIDYLIANTNVDRSNIVVFGHSGGVDWAMRTAVINPNVSRVAVMVAPSPATFANTADQTPEYAAARGAYFARRFNEQYRFIYGKDVPDWNRWELTQLDVKYPDDIWATYFKAGHKPFLLILGERDQPSGHESERRNFAAVTDPKDMILVRRSDHYLNTAQSMGLVFYDAGVADQLTTDLTAWLRRR